MAKPDLFTPIVDAARLNLPFTKAATLLGTAPARDEMRAAYENFDDIDGNFLQQFQSDAYEARLFELFLSALFRHEGFTRDVSFDRPDFVLTSATGVQLAVEAVTANPSAGAPPAVLLPPPNEDIATAFQRIMKKMYEQNTALARAAAEEEYKTRLARPLSAKLAKRYWDLPQVAGKPLVIAVQDFHEEGSNLLMSGPFTDFLYGDFFHRQDTNHISAVLFVNGGTGAKFNRMRYQAHASKYPSVTAMVRGGYHSKRDQTDLKLEWFVYQVGNPAWIETWPQGITVVHHPEARVPLAPDIFANMKQYVWSDGGLTIRLPDFHPEMSITMTLTAVPDADTPPPNPLGRR